jgi:two-component system phosphate regulon response regulator PhoB
MNASTSLAPQSCCVLIVEDDPDVRDLLRVLLVAEGYRVVTVANGRDGLDYLRSSADTCIVLLDWLMPVMDGERFRRQQLRDRSLAWIPVIAVSGGMESAHSARELGIDRILLKPLDLDRVRDSVRDVRCPRHPQRLRPA